MQSLFMQSNANRFSYKPLKVRLDISIGLCKFKQLTFHSLLLFASRP